MKNKETINQLKLIAVPSLIFVIITISSIFLIEVNMVIALLLEILNYIIYLFVLVLKLNGYKLKYLILGKNFKKQLNDYKIYYIKDENACLNPYILKWKKKIYRRTGRIVSEVETPNSFIWQRYKSFIIYGKSLSDEDYLLCVMNDYMSSGGGLYSIFECICINYSYLQYKEIVTNSNKFSSKLKNYLLKPQFERIYNIILLEESEDHYERSTIDDEAFLEFEDESNKLDIFTNEIKSLYEKTAIDLYLDLYSHKGLPNDYTNLYFSEDKRKRLCIFFEKKINSYSAFEEEFLFDLDYNIENNQFNVEATELISNGYWHLLNQYGYYDSIASIKKDLNNILEKYKETR